MYIMQDHETLASIAQKYYGSAEKVTRIWEANPTLPRTRGPLPAGTKVIITPIFPRRKCSQTEPSEQKKNSTVQCKQAEKASLSSRGATIPTE
ncbi:MAG: LysM peptidoglycan-binding domain-containing protein [Lentisphaerae bacterium]|nr:MAG: LysM peptidoglycan-binding domain-containing protein [Lentisphaerota bacterium]